MSDHVTEPKKRKLPLALKLGGALLLGVLAITVGTFAAFARIDGQKIVRGVAIADQDMSMLEPDAALKALTARAEAQSLTFTLNGRQLVIEPSDVAELAPVDVESAVNKAASVGRGGSPIGSFAARLRAAFVGVNIGVPRKLDRVALRQAVSTHYAENVAPAMNAGFDVTFGSDGKPVVTVTEAAEGIDVNYEDLMRAAETRLAGLSTEPIVLATRRERPRLSADDVRPLTDAAAAAIMRAPFTLVAKDNAYTLSRAEFADWIVATADDSGAATLSLDHEKAAAFLAEETADIRKEPSDAEFEEKDGKVTKFVPHVNGEAVDAEAVVALLTDSAFRTVIEGETSSRIEMPLTVVEPEITTEKSNPYGIKEIIGIGASNFRGSPANRRHNIAIGAKSVWGTLVPAGEEFSMIKTLGVIDGTTGYKQELVIKENRTTPEYGGGLCQIGSTAFRAALDSGLPITMRKNHSYRVPYYERDGDGNNIGPGKDATIYDPLPDFRFANDTAHAMLITTKITGDKVEFFFWGVKDGRVAEQTKARVYNIVAPPPTKIIQTTDLPIGQKKCTESAHVGSNASFDYKVTMANGEVREKEFVSYYRPWQEVCLVGVDPATLPPGVTSQELPSPDSTAVDAPAGTVPPATPTPTPAPADPAPATP